MRRRFPPLPPTPVPWVGRSLGEVGGDESAIRLVHPMSGPGPPFTLSPDLPPAGFRPEVPGNFIVERTMLYGQDRPLYPLR
jgi:hypothetical protein